MRTITRKTLMAAITAIPILAFAYPGPQRVEINVWQNTAELSWEGSVNGSTFRVYRSSLPDSLRAENLSNLTPVATIVQNAWIGRIKWADRDINNNQQMFYAITEER